MFGYFRMEKSKRCYPTRSIKIAKLEENEISGKKSPALSKIRNVESSATAKHFISGYASPPCRHVTLSQQNENEIIWDLTSPGARKYQGLLSDKKTSTPNQTPTRKRELRPRITLCKKNIALAEDKNSDLVDELTALNDMVNMNQAEIIMTPPRSVKGSATDSCDLLVEKMKPTLPSNLNTSDAFDDDSFFSESLLLSTQALEEEAIGCKPTPPKKCRNELLITSYSPTLNSSHIFSFAQPSPEKSIFRRSFDLDCEESLNTVPYKKLNNLVPLLSTDLKLPAQRDGKILPPCSQPHILNDTKACSTQSPLMKGRKYDPCRIATHSVPKILEKQSQIANIVDISTAPMSNGKHQLIKSTSGNRNPLHNSSRSEKSMSPRQPNKAAYGMGIKRIVDDQMWNKKPVHQTSFLPPPPKFKQQDPFGDDDDDLLCAMTAVAQEVESQYVPATCGTELDDDDVDFQPEVLAFISQIETQAIKMIKPTAELLEEKRQEAIRKRQQRLMSRH